MVENNKDYLKIVEKYRKMAPLLRNTVGANTPEPSLFATMIFQLETINNNLEKLVAQTTKPIVEEIVVTNITPTQPPASTKPTK